MWLVLDVHFFSLLSGILSSGRTTVGVCRFLSSQTCGRFQSLAVTGRAAVYRFLWGYGIRC